MESDHVIRKLGAQNERLTNEVQDLREVLDTLEATFTDPQGRRDPSATMVIRTIWEAEQRNHLEQADRLAAQLRSLSL